MSLREYRKKRDFSHTREPAPVEHGEPSEHELRFVIQKHDASRLHYDFRLEMEGVLKSWAVPKGIPFEQGDKRIAVHVEDHPLDYADFEGNIPPGEYGAGTVMVWDRGTYTVSGASPIRALEEGKLHLCLTGEKLKGEWTLVRTRQNAGEEKESWLLMKTGASVRSPGRRRDDQSVVSGRGMKQIAAEPEATWRSDHDASAVFHAPMRAKLVDQLPDHEGWIYEVKFDGYRALAIKNSGEVQLLSRNEKPLRFPELTEAAGALPCRTAVLDGEIVALDSEGRPTFQLLQAREMGEPSPIAYYLFDLLVLDGVDLRKQPLSERRLKLASLLQGTPGPLRFSPDLPGKASDVLAQIQGRGMEGIVAKRMDSVYESGAASGAWVKFKCINEQEFVVGGYTLSARRLFASVLLGYYENGKLRYAGRAGSGFSERLQEQLFRRFQSFRTPQCPFSDLPSKSAGKWNQGITPAKMKECVWLRPELVCEVKFTEWTRDGKLRQPVFLGMRDDRPAGTVVREQPV